MGEFGINRINLYNEGSLYDTTGGNAYSPPPPPPQLYYMDRSGDPYENRALEDYRPRSE